MNYVFGYGSLMNPKSLERTLPGKKRALRVCLKNYQRKFDMPVDGHLYLNIVPRNGQSVEGVCIPVSPKELAMLKKRERGYSCVNVTKNMTKNFTGEVFAFISAEKSFPDMAVLQTYIDTCLAGVPKNKRKKWLADSIIENRIENDRKNPKYANIAK